MLDLTLQQLKLDADLERALRESGVNWSEAYIDHNSLLPLPIFHIERAQYRVAWNFIRELFNYVLNERVVILGGNDNEGWGPYSTPFRTNKNIYLTFIQFADCPVVIVDREKNGWWYVRRPGEDYLNEVSARIHFDHSAKPPARWKPRMVDLKITDRCTRGCPYCYQGSSPNGKVASYYATRDRIGIFGILNELVEMGVQEVAIGGGEPFLDSVLIRDVISGAKSIGLDVGISTGTMSFMENESLYSMLVEDGVVVGYSPSNLTELKAACHAINERLEFHSSFLLHLVEGLFTIEELNILLDYHHIPNLLFLGLKALPSGELPSMTGAMGNEMLRWVQDKQVTYKTNISIDTAFANKWQHILSNLKVPYLSYRTKEGEWSLYIDAVEQIIAADSYSAELINFSDIDEFRSIMKNLFNIEEK